MLCDYDSSPSSAEEKEGPINRKTLAMEFQADARRVLSKKKVASPVSPISSENSFNEPPGPPISISRRRSSSRDRSYSRREKKKNISKSESKHRSRRHEKSKHRRSHSRTRRSTSRKHSRKKRGHHHSSHKRDRHHRHDSRHHRYRRKHRRHSSTSSSTSNSSSSSSSSSSDKRDGSRKSSSKKIDPKPTDTNKQSQPMPIVSSTNSTLTATTTVTTMTQASTSTPTPFVPRINPQEILDKIQKHQEAQAKAQAIVAAAAANLPKYYNPVAVNALKLAEQQQKRKLLWSKKDGDSNETDKTSLWTTTSLIAGKGDSAAAAKFRKLMGIHDQSKSDGDPSNGSHTIPLDETDAIRRAEAQAELFRRLEQEYEMSRTLTHSQRGVGLGFAAASHVDYSAYSAMHNEAKDKNL